MVRPADLYIAAVNFVTSHVAAFHIDDDHVQRACDDIHDLIHNFFHVHPPAYNHVLDDLNHPPVSSPARGLSGGG